MKEYTYRRTNFYALQAEFNFPDAHKNFEIKLRPESVVEDAVTYLLDGTSYLFFPGAARAVAIAAADIVSTHFNEDFFEVLSDPYLMHNNDPYFLPYNLDSNVYDEILKRCPRIKINWSSERMKLTHDLLINEYMLTPESLKLLPRW